MEVFRSAITRPAVANLAEIPIQAGAGRIHPSEVGSGTASEHLCLVADESAAYRKSQGTPEAGGPILFR